jgi:hypothetical protein
MQQKAIAAGLEFTSSSRVSGTEIDTAPTDSFTPFMHGLYRMARFGKPYYRRIGAGKQPVTNGWSTPINEWIDASVFERWHRHPLYRPPNLEDWAKRQGRSLENIHGECAA